MDWIRRVRLKVNVPFLHTFGVYELNDETGEVWRIDGTERIGPLRPALSQYMNLLASDSKYVTFLSREPIDQQ